MDGFLIRGWELILARCGGTSALARGATLAARRLREPNQSAIAQWGWVFTPFGAVSTRGICVFVPRFLEL